MIVSYDTSAECVCVYMCVCVRGCRTILYPSSPLQHFVLLAVCPEHSELASLTVYNHHGRKEEERRERQKKKAVQKKPKWIGQKQYTIYTLMKSKTEHFLPHLLCFYSRSPGTTTSVGVPRANTASSMTHNLALTCDTVLHTLSSIPTRRTYCYSLERQTLLLYAPCLWRWNKIRYTPPFISINHTIPKWSVALTNEGSSYNSLFLPVSGHLPALHAKQNASLTNSVSWISFASWSTTNKFQYSQVTLPLHEHQQNRTNGHQYT